MNKVYELLVDQVITKLEQGIVPWNKPWVGGVPSNYISQNEYKGLNKLILGLNNFEDQRYLTIKQVNDLGGKIIKGSKGTKIFYFKYPENDSDESEEIMYPIIRYYNIFNIEQVEGIEYKDVAHEDSSNLYKAQAIVTNYKEKPTIKHGLNASYDVLNDIVTIPSLHRFKCNGEYFSTLFHELIHSTGNINRLSRFSGSNIEYYGDIEYSKEELIAELGSMFLCMETGVIKNTFENSKNYIAGWLKYIKGNKQDLITASIEAEKAVNYIIGLNVS